ncbi:MULTISPECIES: hypothetical protein [unclassified Paenibacillus]|uniref:hypothetical protein n=1 Tax=unclassified Paenibacillus TaxID=185978 RepID=UPI00095667C8|nr:MULTISPECIES: hypothetical protein [unclassified Paenibacillus]ASS66390.1 hypothetical protein CIC07_09670 [Paenibacillus sp. RUD330]SIQ05844.1 Loader and inhibitor of phage G40P [Paenibacillus sp. RU4X]SIQ25990.1 Loader and inhibitor of phage G40P [Paenibacillus sp. RU4T]
MNKQEVGMLFDRIVRFYPSFRVGEDKRAMLLDWHQVLADVDVHTAMVNLERYTANAENRFAPHPGALKKPLQTDAERYHGSMRAAGEETLEDWERMRALAVGPSDEQRERVRKLAKRDER